MIRAVILFLQITALVFAGVWLANEPGTVTIVWRDWRIDPPIGLAVLVVFLIALATALGYRAWRFFLRAPGRLVASHRINRERRGFRALADGMMALAGGDSTSAQRQAKRAAALLDQPAATNLLLAQAAELAGNAAAAQSHFEAMLKTPETAFAGLQGLMRHRMASGDTGGALMYARRAATLRPGATWLLPDLFRLLVAAKAWADADSTIAEAIRRRAVPADEGKRWRAAVLAHRGRLTESDGDTVAAIGFMREATDLHPELVPAAIAYSRLLDAEGKTRRATRVLEHAWVRAPHPDIASAYADLVGGEDPLARVKASQRLLSFNPQHACGRLFVAEMSLQAQLWGEARKYLDMVLKSHPTASAFRLMARLEEAEGGTPEATNAWLSRIPMAAPDECWTCGSCGSVFEQWEPVCVNCTAIATIEWRAPAKAPSTKLLSGPSRLALPASTDSDGMIG